MTGHFSAPMKQSKCLLNKEKNSKTEKFQNQMQHHIIVR